MEICVLCAIPFILAVLGLWLFRRWSMRGFQSAIVMDGATCLKADDGSVLIKRRTVRNWIVLTVIVGLGLPLMAGVMWAIIGKGLEGEVALDDIVGGLLVLIGVGGIISAGVFTLVRSLRLPAIHIKVDSKMLESGRGSSLRQVPFSSLSKVVVELRARGIMEAHQTGVYGIGVILDDGDRLELGTVSGKVAQAKERANIIAQWVMEVTGLHGHHNLPKM